MNQNLINDLKLCQFESWYSVFKHKNITMKSKIIPLTDSFIKYIKQDGINIPESIEIMTDMNNWDIEENYDKLLNEYPFVIDIKNIHKAIMELYSIDNTSSQKRINFELFVKTNWNCCKDANWILLNQSMKCQSINDILMIVQASDRILYDIGLIESINETVRAKHSDCIIAPVDNQNPNMNNNHHLIPYTLVLRKWANLNHAMEFRCFVRNRKFIGVCQRECTTYFNYLASMLYKPYSNVNQSERHNSEEDINSINLLEPICLAMENIIKTLQDCEQYCDFKNYVADVYVDKKSKVWLVDINCYHVPIHKENTSTLSNSCNNILNVDEDMLITDSLLFTWTELEEYYQCMVETTSKYPLIKVIESDQDVMLRADGQYRGPIDVHSSANFNDFMSIIEKQKDENSDSDSNN